jgi:hypothetical protein
MGYDLPDLCMKCGAPAMVYKAKTFSWHPGWVYILLFFGLLPFIIVAVIMTKRMTVRVPLCEAHKNHWLGRFLILSGSFLTLFAGGIALFMASLEPNRVGPRNDISGLICVGFVLGLVVWLILAAILSATAIRATEITKRSITLAGVSSAFVEAYREDWQDFTKNMDQAVREHWQQDRDRPFRGDDRYQKEGEET